MAKYYSADPEYTQISERDYNIRLLIEKVLEDHTIEMENYSYFGSNPGVEKNDYDEVAEDIMTVLKLWEEDNE